VIPTADYIHTVLDVSMIPNESRSKWVEFARRLVRLTPTDALPISADIEFLEKMGGRLAVMPLDHQG
jgi:hypothetical protein